MFCDFNEFDIFPQLAKLKLNCDDIWEKGI